MKKKNNKGFSLIELIIAIAILVILTGLLAPQFMKYIEKSREAKDVQAMDTVYTSVQAALASEDAYNYMTGDDGTKSGQQIYNESLETLLKEETDNSFANELKSLIPTSKVELQSQKAQDGELYIAIQYIPVTTTNDIDTIGGFEVMVYCSADNGSTKVPGFQVIGSNFNLSTGEEEEEPTV